jgi:hypothetical protein
VDISPLNVAFHRSVAVTVGVVWAALVSRFWWPSEARRELSKALGELSKRRTSTFQKYSNILLSRFCLNIGWLYTRLVASNSNSSEVENDVNDDSGDFSGAVGGVSSLSRPAFKRLSNSIQQFMAMYVISCVD